MKPKRILVVDDDVSFTGSLKLDLQRTGRYEVCVANWAEDALPLAREFRPDVVLLEVIMPRLMGGNVAARLRADGGFQRLPIIFLTAAVSRARIQEHGGVINGFPLLGKPASIEEITDRIEQVLASQNNPATGGPSAYRAATVVSRAG